MVIGRINNNTDEQIEDRRTKLQVRLLSHTPHPLQLIHVACTQCYSDGWAGDVKFQNIDEKVNSEEIGNELFDQDRISFLTKKTDLIRKIISSGHNSVIEHVSFTFAVAGVSRALSHQLVRHRIAQFSQQSQRYVPGHQFAFIVPPNIQKSEKALKKFLEVMEYLGDAYTDISVTLKEEGHEKTANEDSRFVLPNAAETRIVFTMNCRSLLNFLGHRCCNRAQWEIRALAQAILKEVNKIIPVVFENAGAPCETLKYCPENAKFSCGKYPLKDK